MTLPTFPPNEPDKGEDLVKESQAVVNRTNQEDSQTEHLHRPDEVHRLAPVENHEATVEQQRVKRQHHTVRPPLFLTKTDDHP